MQTSTVKTNISYRRVGDYLIPNLKLPEDEKGIHIGVWGMRRKNYLMQNNRILFSIMLTDVTLWKHLAEVDKEAKEMFSRLVTEMAKAEGITEELKETSQLEWVARMNNIRNRVEEIVYSEVIYN